MRALPFAHPRIGNLIDRSFRPGIRERSFSVVAAMIVDDGVAVVLRVSLQLRAKPCHFILRLLGRRTIPFRDFSGVA